MKRCFRDRAYPHRRDYHESGFEHVWLSIPTTTSEYQLTGSTWVINNHNIERIQKFVLTGEIPCQTESWIYKA